MTVPRGEARGNLAADNGCPQMLGPGCLDMPPDFRNPVHTSVNLPALLAPVSRQDSDVCTCHLEPLILGVGPLSCALEQLGSLIAANGQCSES